MVQSKYRRVVSDLHWVIQWLMSIQLCLVSWATEFLWKRRTAFPPEIPWLVSIKKRGGRPWRDNGVGRIFNLGSKKKKRNEVGKKSQFSWARSTRGETDGYTSGSTGNQECQVSEKTDVETNEGKKKGTKILTVAGGDSEPRRAGGLTSSDASCRLRWRKKVFFQRER